MKSILAAGAVVAGLWLLFCATGGRELACTLQAIKYAECEDEPDYDLTELRQGNGE